MEISEIKQMLLDRAIERLPVSISVYNKIEIPEPPYYQIVVTFLEGESHVGSILYKRNDIPGRIFPHRIVLSPYTNKKEIYKENDKTYFLMFDYCTIHEVFYYTFRFF